MGVVDRRQQLFDALVRLRRAERRAAPDEDLVAVRSMLEEELGETMSRRLAARILDVDHKALDRWVKSGDLPLVYSRSGRTEIPVAAVLELFEAVSESRENGSRRQRHLEPSMIEARRRAEQLDPEKLVDRAQDDDGHGRAERRSLAYHRALAKRLRRSMVDEALRRLWKWRSQGRIDPRYAEDWERVLRLPLADVRRVMGEDSPRGRDLRQNSPFAGMLTEAERRKITREVR